MPNSENPVFMIHRTHDMFRIWEDKIFSEHGLTTEQYMVIAAIKDLKNPVRPTDVGRRLTRSVNSVSMIVDRMVKAGLVRRVRDHKDDRRRVFLTITGRAEELFGPATVSYKEFIRRTLSQVSPEDKGTLARLLGTLQREVSVREVSVTDSVSRLNR